MARGLTLLVVATVAIGSCGSEDLRAAEPDAGVYAAVIREVAPEEPGDPVAAVEKLDRVVYAGPLDEKVEIALEVQVAVVEELERFATIRFVDTKDEAISDGEEREPVLERGVLLLLGAVPAGRSPTVDVARYVDLDDAHRFRVTLNRSGGEWRVVTTSKSPRR